MLHRIMEENQVLWRHFPYFLHLYCPLKWQFLPCKGYQKKLGNKGDFNEKRKGLEVSLANQTYMKLLLMGEISTHIFIGFFILYTYERFLFPLLIVLFCLLAAFIAAKKSLIMIMLKGNSNHDNSYMHLCLLMGYICFLKREFCFSLEPPSLLLTIMCQ